MKNFLSQTWVCSALVIIAIVLIAVPAFKAAKATKDGEGDKDTQE